MKNKISFFALTLLSSVLFFQCASSNKITSTTTPSAVDQNKETVKLWLEEGWNKKKYASLITRCMTEDWHDGSPMRPDQMEGHVGVENNVETYLLAFPDLHFDITHLVAENDLVVVRSEITATHLGEAFGIPATGKKVTTSNILLYEMENGKIKVTWQEFDLLGILTQLRDYTTNR